MSAKELIVLISGVPAGEVRLSSSGALSFRYDDAYQGTPLSLSMPVSNRVYPQKTLLPYLQGLLPDSEDERRSIAERFGTGPNNVFGLLCHVGLDCPGGVQLCMPDDLDRVLKREESYEPLSDEQIGERLASLSSHDESWIGSSEHWSLGGNQGKFALAWHDNHWCSCGGSAPTTHIFKNGISGYRLQALNEFFCMKLARTCGVPAADVAYELFDGTPAIIVKRYDRTELQTGTVIRLHQEDLCQALSVSPSQKYTADGGPDANSILGLLEKTPQAPENVRLFTTMLFYNCIIGAPDAHAKNYSVLLQGSDRVLLAPLYDAASGMPYDSLWQGGHLAMGIGGENRFGRMSRTALARYAKNGRLDRVDLTAEWCVGLMRELANRVETNTSPVFESLSYVPGIEELRTHLEPRLTDNCRSIVRSLVE